jgi:hypothetical protein
VVGPATDGGYYLLGLSRPLPSLFEAIDFSTERVLGQTVDRVVLRGTTSMAQPTCRCWRATSGPSPQRGRGGNGPTLANCSLRKYPRPRPLAMIPGSEKPPPAGGGIPRSTACSAVGQATRGPARRDARRSL